MTASTEAKTTIELFDALDDARAAIEKALGASDTDAPEERAVIAARLLSVHRQAKVLVERERSRIDGLR